MTKEQYQKAISEIEKHLKKHETENLHSYFILKDITIIIKMIRFAESEENQNDKKRMNTEEKRKCPRCGHINFFQFYWKGRLIRYCEKCGQYISPNEKKQEANK